MFSVGGGERQHNPDPIEGIAEWLDGLNEYHYAITDGDPIKIDRIMSYTVDEYHSYIRSAKRHSEKIKKQLEQNK